MRLLIIIFIVALATSCEKPTDLHCYLMERIDVDGESIEIGETKCGCSPISSPDGRKTYFYQGKDHLVIKTLECR